MRRILLAVLLVSLLCAPAAALGASIFTVSGTLEDGGTFLGTLSVDRTGNAFVQGSVTDGANSFTLPSNYLGEQLTYPTYSSIDVFAVNSNFDLELFLPSSDLSTYTGGALCSLTNFCLGAADSSFMAPGGPYERFLSIDATSAVTPEPGTLLLFGTGLAGLVGTMRRRRT